PRSSRSQDTAPPRSCPLSLHDALPSYMREVVGDAVRRVVEVSARVDRLGPGPRLRLLPEQEELNLGVGVEGEAEIRGPAERALEDRKSTRLNSSHVSISYAVFCLKKKR